MDTAELIDKISAKDADIGRFVQLALDDARIRDEIMHQMLTHPHIMVYYHCFYVVSKASQIKPKLFYPYWDEIAALLHYKNSYHRDFALTILANLTLVDDEERFSQLFDAYFEHINDEKFMTGQCCIQNSRKILEHKPELQKPILARLLDMDKLCTYTGKQKAVLKCDVLDVLEGIYPRVRSKQVDDFIRSGVYSISPKTKRKAKALITALEL